MHWGFTSHTISRCITDKTCEKHIVRKIESSNYKQFSVHVRFTGMELKQPHYLRCGSDQLHIKQHSLSMKQTGIQGSSFLPDIDEYLPVTTFICDSNSTLTN
jgi:late competence protein required for DNA uptake (superfamily II DNA/RNA helicase)